MRFTIIERIQMFMSHYFAFGIVEQSIIIRKIEEELRLRKVNKYV